jgi:hypothetical protein
MIDPRNVEATTTVDVGVVGYGARKTCGVGKPLLDQVRRIVLVLPGVSERQSHGAPCFFVGDTRALCYFHDHHHGDDRVTLWCPVPPDVRDELLSTEPDRFFAPPTSATGAFSSWLGVVLDSSGGTDVDWGEIAAFVEDAYRTVSPKYLIAELDDH